MVARCWIRGWRSNTVSCVVQNNNDESTDQNEKNGPSLNSAMTQRIESTYEAPPKRLMIHVLIAETP